MSVFFIFSEIDMDFPLFWQTVEERMNYNASDILNVKQILTILGFTTLQSISSLSNKSKMDALELEFFKLKETGQIASRKNLMDEKFAMGTKAIINAISNQTKRGFFGDQEVDSQEILQHVFNDCKNV